MTDVGIPVPDTTKYLILALVVFFSLFGLYLLSMVARLRNLRKDEALIQQLREDNS